MATKLFSLDEAASLLKVDQRTISDKRWRSRVGLPGVKVGRLVRFREVDLERLIARGLERLPGGLEGRP